MPIAPKLTTIAACRAAGLNRDRFNEYVAAGDFDCAPSTVPGRTRLFTADDMVTLVVFRQLLDDGVSSRRAGQLACAAGRAAAESPEEEEILVYEPHVGSMWSFPASKAPAITDYLSGISIKRRIGFNIGHVRRMVEHAIEEELSVIGERDE